MPPDISELTADIAEIKAILKTLKEQVVSHVSEGDKPGGYRDRLLILEQKIAAWEKFMWLRLGIAGLIGGLVAVNSSEAIGLIVKMVFK
jgi:hypothetical protein